MVDIAIVSVITTGIVGLAAAVTPAITRHADRRHENISRKEDNTYKRREQYWSLRESLYLDLIAHCVNGLNILEHHRGGSVDEPFEVRDGLNIGPRLIAYASDQVRELDTALTRIIMVIGEMVKPGEDEFRIAKVAEVTEENRTSSEQRWLDFAYFTYYRFD